MTTFATRILDLWPVPGRRSGRFKEQDGTKDEAVMSEDGTNQQGMRLLNIIMVVVSTWKLMPRRYMEFYLAVSRSSLRTGVVIHDF